MNNSKMWLVVPPAVGVPLFLGAVAVGSFSVHVAVLSNTSWVSDFLSGQPLGTGDQMAAAEIAPTANADAARVGYELPLADGAREITVTFPDGTVKRAVLQPDEILASAAAPPTVSVD